MTLNEFQDFTNEEYKGYPNPISYASIGLAGEVGELLNYIKKQELRGDGDYSQEILLELGDSLHYLVRLAGFLGFTMEEVVQANVEKLTVTRSLNGEDNA